jgi:BirA family biotin operon repressor/biotin-[acetyl-CoA-carboxylase] ligase
VSRPSATPTGPFVVRTVDETGSTNADLLAEARAGAPHGTVLVAHHQTAGRGRLGRTWSAPPGSALLCSVLVRPPRGAPVHGALWAVGLAARQACAEVAGVEAELKWPNDLLVGERKLAGVLAEAAAVDGGGSAIVVGIGLNCTWPDPPADVAEHAVALNQVCGRPVLPADVLAAFLDALAPLLQEWADDPAALRARYRDSLGTIGQDVVAAVAGGEVVGRAIDVTDEGALVVSTDAGEVVVSAGDVHRLRPS